LVASKGLFLFNEPDSGISIFGGVGFMSALPAKGEKLGKMVTAVFVSWSTFIPNNMVVWIQGMKTPLTWT
jgi:hypothetical protein